MFTLRHSLSKEQAYDALQGVFNVLENYYLAKHQGRHSELFDDVSAFLMSHIFSSVNKENELAELVNHDLFRHLPGLVSVMDTQSNFAKINLAKTNVMGYRYADDVEGNSYDMIRGDAAKRSEIFIGEDKQIITTKKPFSYLSYNQYADEKWLLLIGEKAPIFNKENEVIGVLSQAKDYTNSKLFDITRFLINEQDVGWRKLKREAFSYFVFEEESDLNHLNKIEMQTLFYILRGKSANDIAEIVCRTKRTIEDRQALLKYKFNVDSLSQLKEKAILQGYMNLLPEDILDNPHTT